MPVSTGYDYGIRKGLNERGVDNSQIGYNNQTGYVTVGGKDFMRADRNYQGTAYTNQTNFNNAWNQYNKAQQSSVSTPPVTPESRAQTSVGSGPVHPTQQPWNQQRLTGYVSDPRLPDNRYTPQIDQQIQALMALANRQEPTDPYATPEYAAYQAQSERRANQGIRAAQEALGSAGFGRSTTLGERAQGIQNAEAEYLETQVIPQILAAERARQQQQFSNMFSLLDPLIGQQSYVDNRAQTERGNAFDALGLLIGEDQRAIDNRRNDRLDNLSAALQVGAATGRLVSPQEDWTGLFRQGANADTPFNLAGQQQGLANRQANLDAALAYGDRAGQILSPQTDWSGYARQIQNGGNPPTLAGQQFQAGEQQRIFDNAMAQQQFAENVRQFGIEAAARAAGISIDQARLAIDQDANLRQWAELEADLQGAGAPEYSGLTPNQVLDNIRTNYMEPVFAPVNPEAPNLPREQIGERITTDPNRRYQMFLDVVDSNLPSQTAEDQVLLGLGFTREEIAQHEQRAQKEYGISPN